MDLLQRFFPQHMDRLEREKAFFDGPGPLLLSSLDDDDLAILLSGSDRKESQVQQFVCCSLLEKYRLTAILLSCSDRKESQRCSKE